MALEHLYALLETRVLAGSPEQHEVLARRINELAAANGDAWVRRNRADLIRQWEMAIVQGLIPPRGTPDA